MVTKLCFKAPTCICTGKTLQFGGTRKFLEKERDEQRADLSEDDWLGWFKDEHKNADSDDWGEW